MTTLLGFFIISIIYCSSPGPTMLMVINIGVSNESKSRLYSCIAGILLSNITIVTLSSVGLGMIIKDSQLILNLIKYIGAFYLIYIGVNSLIKSFKSYSVTRISNNSSIRYSFVQGFLTSITNPKLLLFYVAFLPQFVTGTLNYQVEFFLWGMSYVVIVFLVMSLYGIMASKLSKHLLQPKMEKIVKRLVGVSFIGFGTILLRFKTT